MSAADPLADPAAAALAEQAAADASVLSDLLAAVGPAEKPHVARESAAAALELLAARRPDALLDHLDDVVALLESDNAFSRMIAVHVLALLAPAVAEDRFAPILDALYAHLSDKVSVSGHILQAAPAIAAAQPGLRARLTAHILDLDARAVPDRLSLLRGYAIESLDAYLPPDERTAPVIEFVSRGLDGDSPKTRKIAFTTLRRWGAIA